MRAWVAERFGKPSDVLVIKDVPIPELEAGQVLVRVETATVNINEIDGIYGRYATLPIPPPFVPGYEVLGRVESAAPGAEEWVGKRVIGVPRGSQGGYAEYAALPINMMFAVPDDMATSTASGIFFPFHLAWLALFDRARLNRGETILIHAAAGGLGSAAVQLAVNAGARVIATAGSAEKVQFCRELGADVAINYREQNFVEAVLDATDGRGVDVALDSVGGDVLEQTWRCLTYGARHVILGFSSGIEQEDERPVLLRNMLFGNFSMVGVMMAYVDDTPHLSSYPTLRLNMATRSLGEQIHQQILDLLERGVVRAVIGREIEFEDLPAGLEAFENRTIIGRLVVHI